MNYVPQINRRAFVVSAAAFGGGLALGVDLPFGANVVRAADGAPEVTAWVVIHPDDRVVIRVARSEMGQGSMTGLAQLVAEELECDWSKVSTEFPTPGESLARNRVWGSFFTAGSRGIRESKDYPVFGGKLASFDATKVMGMPGVKKVVKVGESAVAVVADRWWQAKLALDALPASWDEGANAKVSSASIAEFLKAGLDAEKAI